MMSRTQITLESDRDLGEGSKRMSPDSVFDLGSSGVSDISANKDVMLAQAFLSTRKARQRRVLR